MGSLRRYELVLAGAVAWHTAVSMALITLPLYAHSLDYSAFAIGSLVSLPIPLHMALRLAGGVLADRWSEKTLLLFCLAALVVAGPIFLVADTFMLLVAAQLFIAASRAVFYSTVQAYVTRMPGRRGTGARLGQLHVANSVGNILGTLSGGPLIAFAGFGVTFEVFTAIALLALATGALLPTLTRPSSERSLGQLVAGMVVLAKKPAMWLTLICAFGAALPASLAQSFYPLFVTHLGYGEAIAGVVTAFNAGGSILMGLLVARMVTMRTHRLFFRLGYLGLGAGLLLMPFSVHAALVAVLVGVTGFSSSILDIVFQSLASSMSDERNRASALSMGGLGWSFSHLVVPVSFGALVDGWDYVVAFAVFGIVLVALAASASVVYRWLLSAPEGSQPAPVPAAGQTEAVSPR